MKRPAKQTAATHRETINRAGVIHFLLDVVAGKPQPLRDQAGRIIGWSEPAELPQRISAAQHLANKIAPNLASQELEVSGGEGGQPIQLVLAANVVPPRSGTKDVTPDPQEIEHQQPATDLANFRWSKAKVTNNDDT